MHAVGAFHALRGTAARLFKVLFAFLWARCIWHPEAIPASEGELARELKRVVLPAYDLFLIGMGIMAVVGGMPSFTALYADIVTAAFGWTLLTGAALAGIGVVFPDLWWVEASGKFVIIIVLFAYTIAMWWHVVHGDLSRGVVAFGMTALLILPVWNEIRLGRERDRRKKASEIVRQIGADS